MQTELRGLSICGHVALLENVRLPLSRLARRQQREGPASEGNSCVGVPQTSRETEIRDLHPDTTYVVQVQAIAQWGQKRLKSGKAQLRFTTAPAGKHCFSCHWAPAVPACASVEPPGQTRARVSLSASGWDPGAAGGFFSPLL